MLNIFKSSELITLRAKLNEITEEKRQLESKNSNLNASLESMQSRLDQCSNEIRHTTEATAKRENTLKNELEAVKRLNELSESRFKDSEDNLTRLREEYMEFRKSVRIFIILYLFLSGHATIEPTVGRFEPL